MIVAILRSTTAAGTVISGREQTGTRGWVQARHVTERGSEANSSMDIRNADLTTFLCHAPLFAMLPRLSLQQAAAAAERIELTILHPFEARCL